MSFFMTHESYRRSFGVCLVQQCHRSFWVKMCFWFLHLWENIIYETYRFVRLGMRWVGYIQGVYELIENLILDMKTQKLMSITRILPQLLLLVYYIYIYI